MASGNTIILGMFCGFDLTSQIATINFTGLLKQL